jgi:hypothetical protein
VVPFLFFEKRAVVGDVGTNNTFAAGNNETHSPTGDQDAADFGREPVYFIRIIDVLYHMRAVNKRHRLV